MSASSPSNQPPADPSPRLSKQDVLDQFATDFSNPGSEKSGEYLREQVLSRARRLVSAHRESLVQAMREWLELRRYPHTLLAVDVAVEQELVELRGDLESLADDVGEGRALARHDRAAVDAALAALGGE